MEALIDSESNSFLELVCLHHEKYFPVWICQNSIEKIFFKIHLVRISQLLLNPCYKESVNYSS